jgi:hypothetical protein
LGTLQADDVQLQEVVGRALDKIVFKRCFPGFEWLLELLDDLALNVSAGVPEDLVLIRKTCLSLFDVIRDLAGERKVNFQLLGLGLKRFLAELGARWLALPDSRRFSTHVSNADILQIGAFPGLIPLRFWGHFVKRKLAARALDRPAPAAVVPALKSVVNSGVQQVKRLFSRHNTAE